jgi:hypothetical protein
MYSHTITILFGAVVVNCRRVRRLLELLFSRMLMAAVMLLIFTSTSRVIVWMEEAVDERVLAAAGQRFVRHLPQRILGRCVFVRWLVRMIFLLRGRIAAKVRVEDAVQERVRVGFLVPRVRMMSVTVVILVMQLV